VSRVRYTLFVPGPWDQRLGFWWIAEDHPDLPAVVASPTGVTLTFADLAGRAHRIVHALRARGIRTGDAVAYALPNGVDILAWQLGLSEGGYHGIALNPALSVTEIREILEHSGATAVVADAEYGDRAAELVGVPSVRLHVAVGGALAGFEGDEDVLAGSPTTMPMDRVHGSPISYSSGTTGKPKAIARATVDIDPSVMADQMKLFGRAFSFTPLQGVHMVSAGMHHGGCQSFYLGALNIGQSLAILGKFEAESTLRCIEECHVTTAYMVPTQFVRLLRLSDDVRARYDVSSLQVVVHSAAPCPIDIKHQMMDWWGPVIWETYGGMEGAAAIAKPYRWLEKPGTVGRAVRGMSIKILDDNGVELPANQEGNVYLESAEQTFRYIGDPEQTRSVHRGRAFTLGDIGYLDEDGYLFLCDRAKDMIISGGVNIYPAEVEAVLSTHPLVGDVAVIGVPDPEWGESVKAVVEVVNGATPGDDLAGELIAYCRQRLASFKCPRSIDFRTRLPRSDAGKVYKRTLRAEYWADRRGSRTA
jgi:long-chain acyl-CoA synthetase